MTVADNPVQIEAQPDPFSLRLKAILALPAARNKQRQALAIAAETTSSPQQTARILGTLPDDGAASFPHGGTMFPGSTVEHDAEAQRILSILRSPEAEGREGAALELATGTALPLDQVMALLARMPKVEAQRVLSIAERAALEREFGSAPEEMPARRGNAAEAWARAIEKVNADVAAASPTTTPPATPKMEPHS